MNEITDQQILNVTRNMTTIATERERGAEAMRVVIAEYIGSIANALKQAGKDGAAELLGALHIQIEAIDFHRGKTATPINPDGFVEPGARD